MALFRTRSPDPPPPKPGSTLDDHIVGDLGPELRPFDPRGSPEEGRLARDAESHAGIEALERDVAKQRDKLADHEWPMGLMLLAGVFFAVDVAAAYKLFLDLGFGDVGSALLAVGLSGALLMATKFIAAGGDDDDGQRRRRFFWIGLLLLGFGLTALTVLRRAQYHDLGGGEDTLAPLALAVVLALVAVGSPVIAEWLLRIRRRGAPEWRRLRDLRRELAVRVERQQRAEREIERRDRASHARRAQGQQHAADLRRRHPDVFRDQPPRESDRKGGEHDESM